MDVLVPWQDIADMLLPCYPSSRRGRRPFPLLLMLRIHCLQLWFDLSDCAAEDALHDVLPFRLFAGIGSCVPDRTTIMNFRHFLEKHNAGEQVLTLINLKLKQAGLMMRKGVIIDATIISAPCSVKNKSGQRDPEMRKVLVFESAVDKLRKHHCQFSLNSTGDQLLCTGEEQSMEGDIL